MRLENWPGKQLGRVLLDGRLDWWRRRLLAVVVPLVEWGRLPGVFVDLLVGLAGVTWLRLKGEYHAISGMVVECLAVWWLSRSTWSAEWA